MVKAISKLSEPPDFSREKKWIWHKVIEGSRQMPLSPRKGRGTILNKRRIRKALFPSSTLIVSSNARCWIFHYLNH